MKAAIAALFLAIGIAALVLLGNMAGPAASQAAKASEAEAAYNLGVKYNNEIEHKARALDWFKQAATLGSKKALPHIGAAYETGSGVRQDYKEALAWYRRAAVHGDKQAQDGLGRLYANGWGVRRDNAEAARWYRLAALQDVTHAQYGLGQLYLSGSGVRRDDEAAYFWLALAAKDIDAAIEKRDAAAARLSDERLAAVRLLVGDWHHFNRH